MEEGLDKGVVGDLARTVHALNEPELGNALLEGAGGVLDASVGMEHHSLPRPPRPHGAVQRPQRELYVLPRPIAPAHQPPAVLVHHHRQVAIDGAHLEVGDVAHPHLVRALELDIQALVGDRAEEALNARVRVADRRHARLDAMLAHETGNAMLADTVAAASQHPVHPRATVGATAFAVHRADLGRQRLVLALTLCCARFTSMNSKLSAFDPKQTGWL